MKNLLLIAILLIGTIFIRAQNIKTDNFEIYLNDYMVSEVNISKGMYMTTNKQYFYEGKFEVNYVDTNTSKVYQFYFSTWDKVYKEFIVKDINYKELSPSFSFTDNKNINYTDTLGNTVTKELENVTNVDYAMLSSMLVWLENFPVKK